MQADKLVIVHDPSARRIQSSLDRCHFVADERIHFRMLQLRQINLTPAQQKPRSRNNTFGEEGVSVRPARRASGGGVHSTGPGAIAGSAIEWPRSCRTAARVRNCSWFEGVCLILLQFLNSGWSGRVGLDRTMGFHRIAANGLLLFALPFGRRYAGSIHRGRGGSTGRGRAP